MDPFPCMGEFRLDRCTRRYHYSLQNCLLRRLASFHHSLRRGRRTMSAASKRSALSIFLLSVSWLTFSFLPEVAAAVTGYVRVSQIGYEAGLPARAYVMTTRQVSSVMFKVINSVGRVVASGS